MTHDQMIKPSGERELGWTMRPLEETLLERAPPSSSTTWSARKPGGKPNRLVTGCYLLFKGSH